MRVLSSLSLFCPFFSSLKHYAIELEREIALQLREQIFERERVMEHETTVRSEGGSVNTPHFLSGRERARLKYPEVFVF